MNHREERLAQSWELRDGTVDDEGVVRPEDLVRRSVEIGRPREAIDGELCPSTRESERTPGVAQTNTRSQSPRRARSRTAAERVSHADLGAFTGRPREDDAERQEREDVDRAECSSGIRPGSGVVRKRVVRAIRFASAAHGGSAHRLGEHEDDVSRVARRRACELHRRSREDDGHFAEADGARSVRACRAFGDEASHRAKREHVGRGVLRAMGQKRREGKRDTPYDGRRERRATTDGAPRGREPRDSRRPSLARAWTRGPTKR